MILVPAGFFWSQGGGHREKPRGGVWSLLDFFGAQVPLGFARGPRNSCSRWSETVWGTISRDAGTEKQRVLEEGPWGPGGAFPSLSIQHTDASPDHSDFIVRYRG